MDECRACKFHTDGQCKRGIKMDEPNFNCENSPQNSGCVDEICPAQCFLTETLLINPNYSDINDETILNDSTTLSDLQSIPGEVPSPDVINKRNSMKQKIIDPGFLTSPYNNSVYELNREWFSRDTIGKINTPDNTISCLNSSGTLDIESCNQNDLTEIYKYQNEQVSFTCGDDEYKYKFGKRLPNVSGNFILNTDTLDQLFNKPSSTIIQRKRWDKLNIKYLYENNGIQINNNESQITLTQGQLQGKYSYFNDRGINIEQEFNSVQTDNKYQIYNVDGNFDSSILNNNRSLTGLLSRSGLQPTQDILEEIFNNTSGKFNKLLNDIDTNITDTKYIKYITESQITEWGSLKMFERDLLFGQRKGLMEAPPTKLIDIFMITRDDGTNLDLEYKLNDLMYTGEDDAEYVTRIGSYQTIHELGKNPRDIRYIEEKIKKFLGVDTDLFVDVFLQSNVPYDEICTNGFSSRPMEILGRIIQLDTSITNTEEYFEEKLVIRKVLKYVPSIMKKIIDVAEKYEYAKCDRISKKTLLYKEIYKDLFIDSNVLKFELPDLGIFTFFEDFTRNIYTKILLLIFFGFIITQIVSLFKVNLNMST